MANILDTLTLGEGAILKVDSVPSAGAGTPAPIGSIAEYDSGTTGFVYIKTGAADTAWDPVSTASSAGAINPGVAGRLALYYASGNSLDDVYIQNSQDIDVNIVAQPSRSTAIEYTIPNPGDAVAAASFVLTEGAQTINGAKTFTNDVVMSGNLTVNGSVTSLNTTNTSIKDALITLNKGGAAASATNTGFEIEENATITGYLKTDAARDSYLLKAPATFEAELDLALLTANRKYQYPDASGTITLNSQVSGVANQLSYFSAANSVTSPSGVTTDSLFWDTTNKRLGIGNSAPSVALHVTGSARITSLTSAQFVKSDVNGNLSNALISLTADVSGILPLANGGTNAALTAAAGAVVYSSASALGLSAVGTAGQALLSGGTGAPTWFTSSGVVKATAGVLSTSNVNLTSEVSGILPIANGGTNSSAALNGNRIIVSSASAIVEAAALTNGQLLIGSTGAAPVAAAIAQGANNGVVVANAAGSITLSTAQDIRTSASPTFVSETLTGAGSFFEINDTTAGADMKITMATVNTTDATVTTLATIATVTDTVMLLEAKVTGRRTGGTAGTAGDSATYIRTARIKNIGGTVTISNLQSDYTSEDQAGFNATIVVSGTNALVQVTGTANNNMTWKSVVTKIV